MSVVFVDVDGTLLSGPSSEKLFIAHLVTSRVLTPVQFSQAALFVLRFGRSFGRHTFKKNKAYLAGLSVDRVQAAARAFVNDTLERSIRPEVLTRLDAHRRKGEVIALLTGTPDFLSQPLAERIGVHLSAATVCSAGDGVFTAAPPLVHPFGLEKVRQAERVCRSHGTTLAACTAYADDAYDVPLLRRVGTPIAVHPKPRLRRLAIKMGWEVIPAPGARDPHGRIDDPRPASADLRNPTA